MEKTIEFTLLPQLDSTAVSLFIVILVELTNTVIVNSTYITTNIETAALSTLTAIPCKRRAC